MLYLSLDQNTGVKMTDKKVEKVKLHYIKNESTKRPLVNYSGYDESQGYSDEYIFSDTEVFDARQYEDKKHFSLDKEGFTKVTFKPKDVDYSKPENVKDNYYAEVEKLIKLHTGASDVFVFDHTVRRGLKDSNRRPAYHIHNDYTFATAKTRPVDVLGQDIIGRFKGKRMIQINVWRPINGLVERDPLALMDFTTLDLKDLVETDIKFNDMKTGETHNGEIFALKKNPNQKWFYFSGIDSEEAIMIKGFDSDESKSRFAMHTAFALSGQNEESKHRESIETRTFVFFDM